MKKIILIIFLQGIVSQLYSSNKIQKDSTYLSFLENFNLQKSNYVTDTLVLSNRSPKGTKVLMYHNRNIPFIVFEEHIKTKNDSSKIVFITDNNFSLKLIEKIQFPNNKMGTETKHYSEKYFIIYNNKIQSVYNQYKQLENNSLDSIKQSAILLTDEFELIFKNNYIDLNKRFKNYQLLDSYKLYLRKPRKGLFVLTVMPLASVNSFYFGKHNSNNTYGCYGLSQGLEYYITDKYYISTQIGLITANMPVGADNTSIDQYIYNLYGSMQVGTELNRLHISGGIQTSKIYIPNPDSLIGRNLGFAFSAHFMPYKVFSIGVNYYPNFITWKQQQSTLQYSHSISLDIKLNIRLNKKTCYFNDYADNQLKHATLKNVKLFLFTRTSTYIKYKHKADSIPTFSMGVSSGYNSSYGFLGLFTSIRTFKHLFLNAGIGCDDRLASNNIAAETTFKLAAGFKYFTHYSDGLYIGFNVSDYPQIEAQVQFDNIGPYFPIKYLTTKTFDPKFGYAFRFFKWNTLYIETGYSFLMNKKCWETSDGSTLTQYQTNKLNNTKPGGYSFALGLTFGI